MFNKKGLQETRTIVYVLYVAMMLIIGIFLILAFASNICTTTIDRAFNLEYNSLASRVVYSPECLALQDFYTDLDGSTHYYSDAATLELSKVSAARINECIDYDEDKYDVSVRYLDGDYILGDQDTCSGDWSRSDKILVLLDDGSGTSNGVVTFCLTVDEERHRSGVC